MHYYFNYSIEKLKKENLVSIGRPGLLISGANIDDLASIFPKEVEKAIKDANPSLNKIKYASIFYKSGKKVLHNELERISFTTEGKAQEDQHFYIVQALEKIIKKEDNAHQKP